MRKRGERDGTAIPLLTTRVACANACLCAVCHACASQRAVCAGVRTNRSNVDIYIDISFFDRALPRIPVRRPHPVWLCARRGAPTSPTLIRHAMPWPHRACRHAIHLQRHALGSAGVSHGAHALSNSLQLVSHGTHRALSVDEKRKQSKRNDRGWHLSLNVCRAA